MRNIDWSAVGERLKDATGNDSPNPSTAMDDGLSSVSIQGLSADYDAAAIARLNLPSVSVEELSADIAKGAQVQVLDARPKHYFSRNMDMMRGAIWRDPSRVDEWSKELSADAPVFVYCAYGSTWAAASRQHSASAASTQSTFGAACPRGTQRAASER